MDRLSFATLGHARPTADVQLPSPDTADQTIGILHLGIGAFHRAHQAAFTEDAVAASGERRWGICGVTQRSAAVQEQLLPQDGLYGLLERSPGRTALRVLGAVREVVFAAGQADALDARFDDPAVAVISLTITEKGYSRDARGHLDLADPLVAHDLAG